MEKEVFLCDISDEFILYLSSRNKYWKNIEIDSELDSFLADEASFFLLDKFGGFSKYRLEKWKIIDKDISVDATPISRLHFAALFLKSQGLAYIYKNRGK